MATYAQAKVKTAQANAAVARARARAPPPGVLLFTVALSLGCFLVSDYLLFRSCEDEDSEVPPGFLQTYRQSCTLGTLWTCMYRLVSSSPPSPPVWSSTTGWVYFSLARLLLSGVVFLAFCVTLACVLGCCGFR